MRQVRTVIHRRASRQTYLTGCRVGNSKVSGNSSSKLEVLGISNALCSSGRKIFDPVEGKALDFMARGTPTDAIISDLDLGGRGAEDGRD